MLLPGTPRSGVTRRSSPIWAVATLPQPDARGFFYSSINRCEPHHALLARIHFGINKRGEPLYPAMPYVFFTKVTREDSDTLYAYIAAPAGAKAGPGWRRAGAASATGRPSMQRAP